MFDLGAILTPAMGVFGVQVVYERPGDPPFDLRAVFDRVHLEMFDANGAAVSALRAQLGVQLAAFPPGFAPQQGDRVTVAFSAGQAVDIAALPPPGMVVESFTVMDVQPDGGGGAALPLSAREPDPLA
jgi:hypothetical protein